MGAALAEGVIGRHALSGNAEKPFASIADFTFSIFSPVRNPPSLHLVASGVK
jgi:hypothetical protein